VHHDTDPGGIRSTRSEESCRPDPIKPTPFFPPSSSFSVPPISGILCPVQIVKQGMVPGRRACALRPISR